MKKNKNNIKLFIFLLAVCLVFNCFSVSFAAHMVVSDRTEVVGTGNALSNYSGEAQGGVFLVLSSGELILSKIGFSTNTVTGYNEQQEYVQGVGGAILNAGQLTLKEDVYFYNNTATDFGGAIANINIANTEGSSSVTFTKNNAKIGGAIFNQGTFNVKGNEGKKIKFSSNTATNGGAIYNNGTGSFTIEIDADFLNNNASAGGAIYNENSFNVSDNVKFLNNIATLDGGAILNVSTFTMQNKVNFSTNTATNGGAIYNNCKFDIGHDANFSSNTATGYGGAILNLGSFVIKDSATFSKNRAERGGAIFNQGTTFKIGKYAKFLNNTATRYGGAILNVNNTFNISDNAIFSGNTAEEVGGAIFTQGGEVIIGKNANFSNNTAINGGAIYNYQGTITIEDGADFIGNTAQLGGAIYNDVGTLNLTANTKNIKFEGNTATASAIIDKGGTINLFALNKSKIIFNDTIASFADVEGSVLNINDNSEANGIIELNNNMSGYRGEVNLYNGEIILKAGNLFFLTDKFTIHGGTLTANASYIQNSFKNDGFVNFTGGTNKNNVTGNGTTIIDGSVINNGKIANKVTINFDKQLTTNADPRKIEGAITNNGKLIFTGGTNSNSITGSGTTEIDGTVTNNNTIKTEVTINLGKQLTTNAGNVTGTITNKGNLIFTGGTNSNSITGSGTTQIDGTVTNNNTIKTEVTINSGKQLTTSAGNITGTISNSGNLIFNGGTNSNNVTGNGTTIINGSVINNGKIANKVTINSGKQLTTNANTEKIEGTITNNGNLILTGGINNNWITGNGTTQISGTVVNSSTIANAVTINSGKQLTTNINNITKTITNSGNLILTGGTINNNITGSGNTIINGKITNNNTISNAVTISGTGSELTSTLAKLTGGVTVGSDGILNLQGQIANGILGTGEIKLNETQNITSDISYGGAINLNGYTIDMQNNPKTYNTLTVGSISGTGNLKIDVDMTTVEGKAQANDKIQITNGSQNNGTIKLKSINITNSGDISQKEYENYITYVGGIVDGLDFDISELSTITSDSRRFVFKKGDAGKLNVIISDVNLTLKQFITGYDMAGIAIDDNSFSLTGNLEVEGIIGNTFREGGSPNNLYVYLNNHNLTSNGHNGITTDKGYTLNVESGTVSGFNTAFIVEAGEVPDNDGVLNITGITFTNNQVDIDNGGKINLYGTNKINKVIGAGNINVKTGTLEITSNEEGAIRQSLLSIDTGAGIISNANALKNITNGITNNGTILLTGGTNNNSISGNGELKINGNLENNNIINQNKVTIESGILTHNTGEDLPEGYDHAIITSTNIVVNKGAELIAHSEIKYKNIENNGITKIDVRGEDEEISEDSIKNKDIIKGKGKLWIYNSGFTNANSDSGKGSIKQSTITIEGSKFANEWIIGSDGEKVDLIEVKGSTFTNRGEGTINVVKIENDGKFVNEGEINVSDRINNIGEMTTNASGIAGGLISNSGNLILTGGTNNNWITGNGTTQISGTVINSSTIANAVTINSGKQLTTNINNITKTITNSGNLILTGGTINNNITGSGNTIINGKVTNNIMIGNKVTITGAGSELTATLESLTEGVTVESDGVLNLQGQIANGILGTGEIKLNEAQNITSDISYGGAINLNGYTIDMQNNPKIYNTLTVGSISGTGNLKIDVDMTTVEGKAQANDKIQITNGSKNSGTVKLKSVNITNSGDISQKEYKNYITYVGGIVDGLDFDISELSTITSDSRRFIFKKGDAGKLNVTISDINITLKQFINGYDIEGLPIDDTTYSLAGDLEVEEDIGNTGREAGKQKELYLYLNNYNLISDGHNGITTDKGYTLNVESGTVSGFNTAFMVEAGEVPDNDGVLNITGITFTNNQVDIDNGGKVNLYGTNKINKVIGAGNINVKTGTLEITSNEEGVIRQSLLSIDTGAEIISNASALSMTDGITNNGEIIFTGGINNNDITGSGKTVINGAVINYSIIENDITINSEKQLTTDAGDIDGTITNGGKLILTGGTNNNNVSGIGEMLIGGDVINSTGAAIEQEKIIVYKDYSLKANADDITTQEIINYGEMVFTGGENKSFVSGNSGILNIEGNLDNTKNISQNIISIKGGVFTNKSGMITIGDTINIATGAGLIANANDISPIAQKVINNEGDLELTGGTNNNIISGNGTFTVKNNVINNANIEQKIVKITDSLENRATVTATDMYIDGIFKIGTNGSFYNATNSIIGGNAQIYLQDNKTQFYNFGNLTVNSGQPNLFVDADLANKQMDTISANNDSQINGTINVKAINILSDAQKTTEVLFTSSTVLKDKITSIDTASSKLYKYNVVYNDGYFSFKNRGGVVPETNPIILESQIASAVGGLIMQTTMLNQAFSSIDNIRNRIIQAKQKGLLYASAADVIFENPNRIESGLWIRPFVSQDNANFGKFDIDNTLTGTLAGLDLATGENSLVSFYLGYAGNNQKYEDIKINQTGYIVGVTGMFIKENWYAGITANVNFNKAENETVYGTDSFDMNMYSLGAKAGYNYQIDDKWAIEPNLVIMYGSVGNQEYETKQGAKIDSQNISNIIFEPQVKAKLQLENGWQPYGLIGYLANVSDKGKIVADNIEFETDKINGYVEYGLGVDKTFKNSAWSCYLEATGKSGDRNGFGCNLGVKYSFLTKSEKEDIELIKYLKKKEKFKEQKK